MLYLYIGAGGFLGAILRAYLSTLINWQKPTLFPLATLSINTIGCLLVGFVLTYSLERLSLDYKIRLGLTAGFLGSFTTFSTFSFESVDLLNKGFIFYALSYLILSIFFGLGGVKLGIILARRPAGLRKFISRHNQNNFS